MGAVSKHARHRGISLGVIGVMLAALLPLTAAVPALANGIAAVAYDMVGSASSNLTSYTNVWEPGFTSDYDKFEKLDRDLDADIPYALLDDSLVSYPADTAGIIDDNNHDEFFGISDTVNGDTTDPVVATWVFDTSAGSDYLELSIDFGAMGDFEASDTFVFTYSFDGGTEYTAFESSVDEDGSLTYTLASGTQTTMNDPIAINGTTLTNVLTTHTVALTGSGDALTLTLTAQTDGGSEGFAFQNILIRDGTPPFESAYDMVGSTSQNLTSYTNIWEPGFTSDYDKFEKLDRDLDADIPYALLDDSLVSYPADTAGIIDDNNHDEFFGISDTVNGDTTDPVVATWVFDITGGTNLALSIDFGAMGDFEASDTFVFTYSIDGGTEYTAFESSVDEDGSLTYTLASGTQTTMNDPIAINGTTLTNVLTTFKTNITGTGDALTLTLTAQTDGGSEGFAFQNILIDETATVVEPPTVYLSEIHYDNTGSDTGEFVEVTGDAGTDLSGWSVVLYNGNGGGVYDTIPLSGTIDDEAGGMGALSFDRAGIQNGPDGFALVNDSNELIEFLSYEGSFAATDGVAVGTTSTDIGVFEPSDTPAGRSLQLYNGTWVGPTTASPGDLNTEPVIELICGDPAVAIHDVQGDGASTPIPGAVVEIEGIVVGDFQAYAGGTFDEALDGFMVQEEDADADANAATSEGVFVYAPGGTDVAVGDLVRVMGTVSEYYDLTEVGYVDAIAVCSSGNTLPSPATPVIPTAITDAADAVDWESMEGMRLEITQALYVTETYRLGSFGEVVLSAIGPQDQPNQVEPADSAAADAVRALNTASRIVLDDGEDENESYPNDSWNPATTPYLQNGGTLRSGDAIAGLSGVLHYSFSQYEIQPVNVADPTHPADAIAFTGFTARPDRPDVGSDFTVASFNVLNYFTTLGSRGADTAEELQRQADKIVAAIIALDADVVGLIEIENNGTAIADLVGRLNGSAGATRTYGYIDTGVIGSDAIAVGFIYDVATVAPVGDFAVLDSSVSPAFLDEKNRPALAQTFQEISTTGMVTVAINHLKSKGSACDGLVNPGDPTYGVAAYNDDPNTGGYAGNCNLTRTAAAQVLGQWLDDDPTGTGADYALILGDLNSYANEDPITALEGLGWTDLVETYAGGNAFADGEYSYVFDGEHGTLDYGMVNADGLSAVTGAATWHINSVEPPALDYNDYNPVANYSDDEYRSSDHDPVLIGLDLYRSPREIKLAARDDLEALIGEGTYADDRRVMRAILDINRSLRPVHWLSDSELAEHAKIVFKRERRAVRRLMKSSPAIYDEALAVIEDLVFADRTLAQMALDNSTAPAWAQMRAKKWLRRGDQDAEADRWYLAITDYMKAWVNATREA